MKKKDRKDWKCERDAKPIIIHKGFHIWWCVTHKQPSAWCDKEKEKRKLIEEIKKLLVVPCCHVSGIHDPTHFEEERYICDLQKAEAFDNLCKVFNTETKAIPKSNCGWCKEKMTFDGKMKKLEELVKQ